MASRRDFLRGGAAVSVAAVVPAQAAAAPTYPEPGFTREQGALIDAMTERFGNGSGPMSRDDYLTFRALATAVGLGWALDPL